MKIIKKLFNLKNRTVLLTGASGHLAEKISLILADLGANLILVSRKKNIKIIMIKNYLNFIQK